MKVVYILHSTKRNEGSAKSFLVMLKGLMSHGVEPVVVLPKADGLYNNLQEEGVTVYAVPHRIHVYPKNVYFYDYFLWLPRLLYWLFLNHNAKKTLRKICQEEQPEIIHSNTSVLNFGYEVARQLHIPHIYHIREYGDLDFGYHYIPSRRAVIKKLANDNNTSIFITDGIRRHFRQHDSQNAYVVYNPIACDSSTHEANDKHYFLFVGRINKGKGVDMLLRAYRRYLALSASPLPLKLAGWRSDEHLCRQLDSYIAEQGLSDKVEFLGERDDVGEIFHGAKAVVVPSENEAFGRVMPEAMLHHCLVVARNTGGTREQLDNGLAFTNREIALRFTTEEELTAHLVAVEQAPADYYAEMTEAALHTVTHFYSAEANAQRVYDIYRTIISRNCTPQ